LGANLRRMVVDKFTVELARAPSRAHGIVAEWFKAHAWKVCVRQRTEGSNPSDSAMISLAKLVDAKGLVPERVTPSFGFESRG
jgi:hypothetical protein